MSAVGYAKNSKFDGSKENEKEKKETVHKKVTKECVNVLEPKREKKDGHRRRSFEH